MSDNYPVDGELRRQAGRIEALEQAHAELAAKVDALTERLTAISILADRMDDLHARVLAYDETCGQIHNSHIARHNDLACKIERLFGLDKNTSDRLSALESPAPAKGCWKCSYTERILNTSIPGGPSNPCECQRPAPAPDPVCQWTEEERDLLETIAWCGVGNGVMTVGAYEGLTNGTDYAEIARGMLAKGTVPTAEPEPAPLDPVEAIETQAYIYGSSRYWQGVVIKSGEDPSDATSKMLKEWDTLVEMIRAYGRDGAR